LFLNIYTTGTSATPARRPVIVWIHGGGNFDGSSNDYDGSKLATGGPEGVETVVVTLNYRPGLLGYLAHPSLDLQGKPWGNYGTLDQQAALRWVVDNIAKFGGDPSKVTVGGQSAGSYNALAMIASPLSKGLAHRVIAQSSPAFSWEWPGKDATLKKGVAFAEAAGCKGSTKVAADCLRALPVERILQLQGTPDANGPFLTGRPFVDGTIIPKQPSEIWRSGAYDRVPIMAGGTGDEYSFFTGIKQYFSGYGAAQKAMDATVYAEATKAGAFCQWCKGLNVPEGAAARYPLSDYGTDAMLAYQRMVTDVARCLEVQVLREWAKMVPTYAYDFTYAESPFYFPRMTGFKAGAAHTSDSQFAFAGYRGGQLGVNLDQSTGQPREFNGDETKLSDRIVADWTRFADSGNPNGTEDGPWPRFTTEATARYLVQDTPVSTIPVGELRNRYKCDFWDANQN
jgi:para-nitrobenzyl esterase